MSDFIESPLLQARQILSLSPTSPTGMQGSQTSPSTADQFIMPMQQMAHNQKQSILPDTGNK